MSRKETLILHIKSTPSFPLNQHFTKQDMCTFYNFLESGKTLINHRLLSAMFYSPLSAISSSSCAAPSIPARV